MRIMFAVIVGVLILQAPAPEQFPGQRDHAQPPKDFFCQLKGTKGVDDAHACTCTRMQETTKADPDCCNAPPAPEDPKCSVYCWKDHCHCKVGCKIVGHNAAR